MSKVRVPVAGTVGKSIRVDRESTAGATIGTDLRLPNGSVPSLSQLAAALGVNQSARQSSLSNTIWKLIREVPEVLASVGDLTDPNEDAIFYWDDVNGIADWMTEIPDSFLSANVALYDGSVAQFSAGTFLNARISETNVTQHEAAIDHNALTNFVEAQHIDWSVTGIENIHVDRISEAIDQPYVAALGFYTETEIDAFGFLTSVLASDVDSGAATDGFVLTADGAGGAAWEAAPAGGVTDHGALTGLADNDHPQYALLTGATFTGNIISKRITIDDYLVIHDASTLNQVIRTGGNDDNLAILFGSSYDGSLVPVIRGFGGGNLTYSVPAGATHIFSSVSTGGDIQFGATINNLIAGSTDADFNNITATSYGGIAEANLLDKTANETISARYTFTNNAGLNLSSALPEIRVSATGAAVDNKDWLQHLTSTGDLRFAVYAEGFGGGGVSWMQVFRTGTTIDEIQLDATTLDFNGAAVFNSVLTAPSYAIEDTRAVDDAPNAFGKSTQWDFKQRSVLGFPGGETYGGVLTVAPWSDASGGPNYQLAFSASSELPVLSVRAGDHGALASDWRAWRTLVLTDEGNDNVTLAGPIREVNGSVATPAYSFSGDINTGMFWVTTDDLGFSAGGVEIFRVRGGDILSRKPLLMQEVADARTDIGGFGQIWVHNDTPNTLWFTDDAGNDHQMFHYLTAGYKGGGRITVGSTAPGSPVQGDMWFDTS